MRNMERASTNFCIKHTDLKQNGLLRSKMVLLLSKSPLYTVHIDMHWLYWYTCVTLFASQAYSLKNICDFSWKISTLISLLKELLWICSQEFFFRFVRQSSRSFNLAFDKFNDYNNYFHWSMLFHLCASNTYIEILLKIERDSLNYNYINWRLNAINCARILNFFRRRCCSTKLLILMPLNFQYLLKNKCTQ